jgi:hypothetical protein
MKALLEQSEELRLGDANPAAFHRRAKKAVSSGLRIEASFPPSSLHMLDALSKVVHLDESAKI